MFLVGSGSEANDLAIRICREHARAKRGEQRREAKATAAENEPQHDNEKDVFVCLAYAYHGLCSPADVQNADALLQLLLAYIAVCMLSSVCCAAFPLQVPPTL